MPPHDDDDKRERRMQAARDLATLHPLVSTILVSWNGESIPANDRRKRAFTSLVDMHSECIDILADEDEGGR